MTDSVAAIAAAHAAYLQGTDPRTEWVRVAAKKHGFLPTFLGLLSVFGVRLDGVPVVWDNEESGDVLVASGTDARLALAQAAIGFPNLAGLMPARPPTAIDCPDCGGTGSLGPRFPDAIICSCCGTGWLEDGVLESP